MISLICPTRNRIINVINLISNLEDTIKDFGKVELWLCADDDDKITLDYFKTMDYLKSIEKLQSRIFTCTQKRSDFLNKDYYNNIANYCNGKYLFSIGDDVRFRTKGWETILIEKTEEYLKDKRDRIAYISVTERGSQAKHPCFPIITKEAFNALGMYFHPELMSWGADRCLWELYSGINRVLYVPEIEIEHLSYHDGKAPFDKTAESMRERFFRNPNCHNEVSANIIPKQIKELEKFINGMVGKK
jgi:hypothetical protein